jgi:hypothetical protein
MNRATLLGLGLLLVSLAGWWVDARVLLACWLAAWWWCLGLVLGAFVNVWIQRLSGGAWGEPLRPVAFALGRRLPRLLLALLPLLASLHWLYPWAADAGGAWLHVYSRPAFPRVWLSPPFFLLRVALYALAWWWLARPSSIASKGRAAASLALYTLLTSLAAVDLLMSLMPGWFSTAFGLVALSAQALAGTAAAVLLGASQPRTARKPPISRDHGNLLLMWTMTWAYVAFMQFLVIWAENLPHEIAWYVPRLQTGWAAVALALVVLQLALPLLPLLFRSVKDRPQRLKWVAALLLASCALDAAWMVLPSVAPHSLHGWWLLPLCFGGMGLAVFGGVREGLRDAPEAAAEGRELRHARA